MTFHEHEIEVVDVTLDVLDVPVFDPVVDTEPSVIGGLPGPRGATGETGPVGPIGPVGPQGPPGDVSVVDAVLGYRHVQNTPEETWVVEHPLTFAPNVSVFDSTGAEVQGEVEFPPDGSYSPVLLRFSAAFGGTAHLS